MHYGQLEYGNKVILGSCFHNGVTQYNYYSY